MTDKLSKEKRSELMRAVKSKKSLIENSVTHELWKKGIRFRRNVSELKGKPDIAIKKDKIVIFIDSCFWHMCPVHCKIPKSNVEFWMEKLIRNRERDLITTQFYKENNWSILRVWEHELRDDFEACINTIYEFIMEAKKNPELKTSGHKKV
ncbi:very short patch repair endonuclease [Paenibacillus macerans]|uniref:Very short patch repair endonuclease n=1 Tax=Paenibacillus macerans TaxID=44252 RepID=A0A6N8EPX5_PAEMA|nr:very short patch repair endonuclease [Paenibacillus macerans]MBS5911155.1 very short patch repair endonuclease [Paenibacillus macerans]MEC0137599.1 very short patch repair endonuclease [Paenibacillus macerans]MUG22366.1 DNA mismatch endonuclease Vsr [Paenibacillus macerans]OMG46598.1 very short patch repair endonuclease [Paenibacillus macerans]GBK66212.1 very short patch repair endonuclease [Paenibacillus macerans]